MGEEESLLTFAFPFQVSRLLSGLAWPAFHPLFYTFFKNIFFNYLNTQTLDNIFLNIFFSSQI